MSALLFNIAGTAVFNLIQLVAGCLLAVVVFSVFRDKAKVSGDTLKFRILVVVLCSLCGLILPLGIYGILPVAAAIFAAGFKSYAAGALLVSNVVFNMLVPYTDPGFIWRTGLKQVVFAFIAGFTAGILLTLLKDTEGKIFRLKNMPVLPDNLSRFRKVFVLADDSIKKLGLFLVAGVVADTLFRRFILGTVVDAFYASPVTRAIPNFFGGQDVSNPFFLLTFTIIYMLMNLVIFSALTSILKFRGLILYFGYFLAWAVILAIPAFI
jgi:uncharacterized membrane protein YraQ (UPF0718 family)